MIEPYFKSTDKNFTLLQGDCIELLPQIDFKFDMVFADPPYFLSNDGLTVKNGKVVSVNKGEWDKGSDIYQINEFNLKWLSFIRDKMKDDATIWISGTMHNIFSIGQVLTALKFKILNIITWQKTNPPPSWAKRSFTHSTEQIIWARKLTKIPHYYNYDLMKKINDDQQMKDVWTFPAIQKWEKTQGKHETAKPLSVLSRIILASTKPKAWIIDPFTGGSTTGIAANLLNRRFVGIDINKKFLQLSQKRKAEIECPQVQNKFRQNLDGFSNIADLSYYLENESKSFQIYPNRK